MNLILLTTKVILLSLALPTYLLTIDGTLPQWFLVPSALAIGKLIADACCAVSIKKQNRTRFLQNRLNKQTKLN